MRGLYYNMNSLCTQNKTKHRETKIDEVTAAADDAAIDVIHVTCLFRTSMNFGDLRKEQFCKLFESQAIVKLCNKHAAK